ncbi:MAG: presenilin family intramembrane aspartyl protease [Patescibacteria group bacterium]
MKIKLQQFLSFGFLLELFLFAFSLFLAMSIAFNLGSRMQLVPQNTPSNFSAWEFILAFFIGTLILWLSIKYFKRPLLIRIFFYLAIFDGLIIFSQAYFGWPWSLLAFGFIMGIWLAYNNILLHNLILALAISSISVIFGLNLTPNAVIIILLILAIYDYWAVYKTKHMVKMFTGMAEVKVHFAFIIPPAIRGLFQKVKDVSLSSEYVFLGTGDLAMPTIFVVTCLKISLLASFFTAFGAILGFIGLYAIFMSQKDKKPMPGLPPIILGALIGYLVSFLI